MQRTGNAHQIYIPAHTLTGSQVTETEALAEAKLLGRYVPVADSHIESVSSLYRNTAPKRDPRLSGPYDISLQVESLRPDATKSPSGHEPIHQRR